MTYTVDKHGSYDDYLASLTHEYTTARYNVQTATVVHTEAITRLARAEQRLAEYLAKHAAKDDS